MGSPMTGAVPIGLVLVGVATLRVVVRQRWIASLAAAIGATAVALLAPSLVREAPPLLAVATMGLALVTLIDWERVAPAPRRWVRPVALAALAPAAAAHVLWASDASSVAVTAMFLLAGGAVAAYALWPASLDAVLAAHSRWVAVPAAAVALLWTPAAWRMVAHRDDVTVLGLNDYPQHLDIATDLSLFPFRLGVPELGFHVAAKDLEPLFGIVGGPTAAIGLFVALTVGAVVWLFRQDSPAGPGLEVAPAVVAAITYFFLETPLMVLRALDLYGTTAPHLTVHWWGNPTWLAALPFSIFAVGLVERAVAECEASSALAPPALRWLAVATTLGVAAKPALMLVLMPGLATHLALVRRPAVRTTARVMALAAGPCSAVILWQMWFLSSEQDDQFTTTWELDPVVEPLMGWTAVATPWFWLPLVFIALAAWATRGAFFTDPSVRLILVSGLYGLLLWLCIRDSGTQGGDGNFGVPLQACLAMLVLLAVRALAVRLVARDRSAPLPAWAAVTGVVTLAFLAGGLVTWLDSVTVLRIPILWEGA